MYNDSDFPPQFARQILAFSCKLGPDCDITGVKEQGDYLIISYKNSKEGWSSWKKELILTSLVDQSRVKTQKIILPTHDILKKLFEVNPRPKYLLPPIPNAAPPIIKDIPEDIKNRFDAAQNNLQNKEEEEKKELSPDDYPDFVEVIEYQKYSYEKYKKYVYMF